MEINKVHFKDARDMVEVEDNSVQLIVTSPPYWNVKDYSLDGRQQYRHSKKREGQIGDISDYKEYIKAMTPVWKECERILKPNGKLCVNAPLMPILKRMFNSHYNRHIVNINSDIEHDILNSTGLYLYDLFIWNRTNPSKKLMFGSYPYPPNFYAQNTIEFITIFVKDGEPQNHLSEEIKYQSKLSQEEWVKFTKQIWDIPIPGRNDLAFGKHSAIMPKEIVYRLVKLFSFVGDIVLDPFAGSGTTLKVAKDLDRNYIGYEIISSYEKIINKKLSTQLKLVHF